MSFLPSVECGKFKLKKAFQSGKILACTEKSEICASSTLKLINRGGVEDTRLEAKAKDTKKSEAKDNLSEDRHSRGQGQECSRPRPRTKDTSASALQKKKEGFHKNFSSDLHKNTFSKKFFKRSTKF